MKSIVILTANHLCHNPRVIKEATTAARAGYKVSVLGAWIDPVLKSQDEKLLRGSPYEFIPVLDYAYGKKRNLHRRIRLSVAKLAYRYVGVETVYQLGVAVSALNKAATERDADLVIAHSEAGMVVATQLLAKGRNVGVDMEDWFSEDLLPTARKERPLALLRSLELKLLRSGRYRTCPSEAMSVALAREYKCEPPTVIYNAFPWSDREMLDGIFKDREDRTIPSIHWYSQTIGFGRGLEDLVAALPFLKERAEIHLRGRLSSDFADWLHHNVPSDWRSNVFVHDPVSNGELLSRISEHDIGFAGEEKFCRSRDLTVTNKIMHYLLGGLAVVASDTAGQREIADHAGPKVRRYRSGDYLELAAGFNSLMESREELGKAKEASLEAAERAFCWERQAPKLIASIEAALSGD